MMRHPLIVPIFLLASFWSAMAHADEASEAQLQYELGAEFYRQGRYEEALERFLASNRLVPNPNVVFNIAQVYGLLDRQREAYNWFETYLVRFDVSDEERREVVDAQQRAAEHVAVLDVQTAPANSVLYVDRLELGAVGRSPRRVAVEPGRRTLIARLEGHHEERVTVDAVAGEQVPVELRLEPVVGTLVVTSGQPGVVVHRQGAGEAMGTVPFERALPIGVVTLVARAEGYVEQSRTLEIREGETARVSFALVRAASNAAVFSVVASPPGAAVRLAGEDVGRAPLTLPSVAPGTKSLAVTAAGRDPWEGRILLEPGGATRVRVTLADPAERPWPGWRWIGYGGGAGLFVVGAIVGLVAVSERSAFFDASNPTETDLDSLETLNATADALMGAGLLVVGATFVWDLLRDPGPTSQASIELSR